MTGRIVTPEICEHMFKWLRDCAAVGQPCPTNAEISARFGFRSVASGAKLVGLLEKSGRIGVQRTRTTRVVRIVETGKSTAAMVHNGPLSPRPIKKRSIAARQALSITCARKRMQRAAMQENVSAGPYSPARNCQWIADDPTGDDSCKCGAETIPGKPYCAAHFARSYAGFGKGFAA